MKNLFLICIFCSLPFTLKAGIQPSLPEATIPGIFKPIFAVDTLLSREISLINQQFRIDILPGYAVVRADYWLNNPTDKAISFIAGFPSCKNFQGKDCTEMYWLRTMINSGSPAATTERAAHPPGKNLDQNILDKKIYKTWQTWNLDLQPGVTQVSINYGIKTAGADIQASAGALKGKAIRIDFSSIKGWGSGGKKGELWLRMNGGLITKDILSLFPGKQFLAGNSLVFGRLEDIISDTSQEVLLTYRNILENDLNPSQVNWQLRYSKLKSWNVNEKILSTLSPFSVGGVEEKKEDLPVSPANNLIWIVGSAVAAIVLLLLIWAYRRKAT